MLLLNRPLLNFAFLFSFIFPCIFLLIPALASALDEGDILVSERGEGSAIIRIDPVTGDRTTLSGCEARPCVSTRGTGPNFVAPRGIAYESRNSVLVADTGFVALVRVNSRTGSRLVLSGCVDAGCTSTRGSGPPLVGPSDVVVEEDGGIVVTDWNVGEASTIMRIDPVSGDRTIFSGCLDPVCASSVGDGVDFNSLEGIVIEAGGTMLVSDTGFAAIFRVRANGDRDLLSHFSISDGSNFGQVLGIALQATGDLVVADISEDSVFRVDTIEGQEGEVSVLSGCDDPSCTTTTGTGVAFFSPYGVAVEADRSVVATNSSPAAIFRIDPVTGDRTVFSGCEDGACTPTVGTGRVLEQPGRIAVVPTNTRMLFSFETETPGSPPDGIIMGVGITTVGSVTVQSTVDFPSLTSRASSEGRQLAYLTTGPQGNGGGSSGLDRSGNGVDESDVASMFVNFENRPGDPPHLEFDFDVITDEDSSEEIFADPFEIRLDGIPLVQGSMNSPNGDFPRVEGFDDMRIVGPDGSDFHDGRLGFAIIRVPDLPHGLHTLEFFVGDETDDEGDTGLFVDGIRLVPEPSITLSTACVVACLSVLARRKQSANRGADARS